MSITIEMPDHELAAIKKLTHLDNDADAIVRAAREFLRLTAIRELKAPSGKVDFDSEWQNLESLELSKEALPR